MNVLRRLWDIVRQIRAFVLWLWSLVSRIFGPPAMAIHRVVMRVLRAIKAAVLWLVERWEKLWSTGKVDRGRESYVGANGVLLLATLTLFATWYMAPVARMLEVGPPRFVAIGFVLLAGYAVLWRSACREDRASRFAVWVQTVCRSTGLRRFDQLGMLLAALMAWMAWHEPQLWPLAFGAVSSFVGLLIQDLVPRTAADVFAIPGFHPFGPVDESEIVGFDVSLNWALDIQGITHQHAATVRVSQLSLDAARAANVKFSANIEEIVNWVVDLPSGEVDRLAFQIREQVEREGYSHYGAVACHAAACQAIPYSLDEDSTGHDEYWRYPVETLADQTGDCEDTSILLAALLRRAGYPCVLIDLPGHIAVGVHVPDDIPGAVCELQGKHYYYCETTATGWRVGEMPARYRNAPVQVIPVPALGES